MSETLSPQDTLLPWSIEHRMNDSNIWTRLTLKRSDGYMLIRGELSGERVSAGLINCDTMVELVDAAHTVYHHRVHSADEPSTLKTIVKEVQLQIGVSFKLIKLQDGFVRFILINQGNRFSNICVEADQRVLSGLIALLVFHPWYIRNGQRLAMQMS